MIWTTWKRVKDEPQRFLDLKTWRYYVDGSVLGILLRNYNNFFYVSLSLARYYLCGGLIKMLL